MAILVFDTETSGLPRRVASKHSDYSTARIVSIAWVVMEADFEVVEEQYHIVKPSNFEISKKAIEIHGISNERAHAEGQPLSQVLHHLFQTLVVTYPTLSILAAHNLDFDINVLLNELSSEDEREQALKTRLTTMEKVCTMRNTAHLFPNKKWPRLHELYAHCFPDQAPMRDAHNALFDTRHCAECVHWLLSRPPMPQIPDIPEMDTLHKNKRPRPTPASRGRRPVKRQKRS